MPSYAEGTCFVTTPGTPTSKRYASGTCTLTGGGDPVAGTYAEGDCEIDGTVWESFAAGLFTRASRVSGAKATLDGDEIGDIVSDIVVDDDLETMVQTATFDLDTPRACVDDPATIAGQILDCEVTFIQGPPGALTELLMFRGAAYVEAVEGDLRPVARVRAAGPGADIFEKLKKLVCLSLQPLAGYTRGEIILLGLESIGVTVSNSAAIAALGGGAYKKPVEVKDLTGLAFVARWGEPFGLLPRLDLQTGELELLSEDLLYSQPAKITLDEDYLLSPPQLVPTIAPITSCTISGTALTAATAAQSGAQVQQPTQRTGGLDPNGLPYYTDVDVTLWDGVEVRRRERGYQTVQAGGVALGPLVTQEVFRVESETTWATIFDSAGLPHPSARPIKRVTRVYQLEGVEASVDYPSYYTWTDGTTRTTSSADLILWEQTTETFSWSSVVAGDPDDCTLQGHYTEKYAWYSPRADVGGTHHDYGDGDTPIPRKDTSFQWQVVSQETETWTDRRRLIPGTVSHPPYVARDVVAKRFAPMGRDADGNVYESGAIVLAEHTTETWTGNAEDTRHHYSKRVKVPPAFVAYSSLYTGQAQLTIQRVEEDRDGPVPGPPVALETMPQIGQELISVTADFSAGFDWPANPVVEFLEHLDSLDECWQVAYRRVRRSAARTYTCETPDLPYLRVGDTFGLTVGSRQLAAAKGYATRIARARGAMGTNKMTTTLRVPHTFPALTVPTRIPS